MCLRSFAVVFLLLLFALAWITIRHPQWIHQYEVRQLDLQPAEEMCDTEAQVLASDEIWDANNKYFVAQFGLKEGLHRHRVAQCIAKARN
jgi:hypothetical protein